MSVYFGYAASLFRRGVGVRARVTKLSRPLFLRRPTGVALFGPLILGLDAFALINVVPLTWTHWREAPEDSSDAEAPAVRPPLRPWWQRACACAIQFTAGAFVAGSVLIYRGRMLTLVSLLPPKNPAVASTASNRRIFIQTAGNWRSNGTIFPLSACTLTRVEEKAMFLQVKGEYAGWQLNLDDSIIDGKPVDSVEQACKTLAAHWHAAGGKGTIKAS
ncbi:hypothetical protein B0H17DRAFT_1100386 [Mycena rosella]|uniref:Uncharacterized protein n=1 Tax=Mycena rosella TaxID=1033263 RepID=A0AAD7G0B1_MYCRO|nr:hypothetical protein B0H17DRAFT_1100386 [Mycena rosella]